MTKCFHCGQAISAAYYKDQYGNCCCLRHIDEEGSVAYCGECERLVARAGNTLSDGRVVCPECMKIAVSPERPFDWILEQVVARLRSFGLTGLEACKIRIWTATDREMAANLKKDINPYEGFCQTNADGTLTVYMRSHHTKINYAGILAHELTHAWCRKEGLEYIAEVEEGMCNLACFCMYQSIDFPLARIYEKRMFDNPDPIYGDGFRAMYTLYQSGGWDAVRKKVTKAEKRNNR